MSTKRSHILKQVLFKYMWPFNGYQALKSYELFINLYIILILFSAFFYLIIFPLVLPFHEEVFENIFLSPKLTYLVSILFSWLSL